MLRSLVPFIAILISIGLYFIQIGPGLQEIRTLQIEEQEFSDALARSQELQAERDRLIVKYNNFATRDLDRLEVLLPDSVDAVRLLLDASAVAAAHDLEIRNVAIERPPEDDIGDALPDEPRRTANDPAGTVNDPALIGGIAPSAFAAKIENSYVDLSFTVDAEYQQVQDFLNSLERSLRLLDIINLSFQSSQESDLTTYSVTVRTYWLR